MGGRPPAAAAAEPSTESTSTAAMSEREPALPCSFPVTPSGGGNVADGKTESDSDNSGGGGGISSGNEAMSSEASTREDVDSSSSDVAQTLARGGDLAAAAVYGSARLVSRAVGASVPPLSAGIDMAGAYVKEHVGGGDNDRRVSPTPPGGADSRSSRRIVRGIYAEHARIVTDAVRRASESAAVEVQDASVRNIGAAARMIEERRAAAVATRAGEGDDENENDDDDNDETTAAEEAALMAAGRVGAATLGGATLIAESILDATLRLSQKTADVTADVVTYRYGSEAGRVVSDASASAGNLARAAMHVGTLEGGAIVTAAAGNAGRATMEEDGSRRFEGDGGG